MDNLNVAKMLEIALDRLENIVGKRENAVYQYAAFSPFLTIFSEVLFLRMV